SGEINWSSINIELWSKYFKARSILAKTKREPSNVKELIQEAAREINKINSVWYNGVVYRFRILLQTLSDLLDETSELNFEIATRRFLQCGQLPGDNTFDEGVIQFFSIATEAFEGFKKDPEAEITTGRLSKAIETLS